MKTALRVTLKRGSKTKRIILLATPHPAIGDSIQILPDGGVTPEEWTVTKASEEQVLFIGPEPVKRKSRGRRR